MDFLGNPVGLINDMASGVTGLMTSTPDVVGLVRDVAHGVTDTTSKVLCVGVGLGVGVVVWGGYVIAREAVLSFIWDSVQAKSPL